MTVTLIGVGMGSWDMMTGEAQAEIMEADAVVGAGRLIDRLPPEVAAFRLRESLPHKVADAVREHSEWERVAVVLSGDVGFYSGARSLLELLDDLGPTLIPGISTPQYLAARLRRPWQDFHLVSAHGVGCDPVAEVLNHPAVFFLTGGAPTPARPRGAVCEAGLGSARVTVGENLSTPDERIVQATAEDMAGQTFSPLSVVLVENKKTFTRAATVFGIPDEEFVRGEVPMTKRAVRVLALSLLRLHDDSVVYDIGAGTGSVSVETALLARRGRVYAVERNPDALDLLGANRERFGALNVRPVLGVAPDALLPLPEPDAVFIGGSGGRMREVVAAVLAKNPGVRLVIAAIALETLTLAMAALDEYGVAGVSVTQVAVNHARLRAGLHMLEAANPVFLLSGGGE